jgi:hypothetical protein
MNRWLITWVMAIVIATVVGLWLGEAGARAQQGTIGDTLPVPDFDGTFVADADLAGNCLKFDTVGDPNTYLCPSAADEVTLTCGGADVWVCNALGCELTGELGAVTSLDATTLATIVAAISGNGSEYDDDASVCWGDDDDFCIEHDTDGSPDGLRLTQKDCDGSPCDPLEFYKSGGANVVIIRASSVTNPDAKMTFGPPGASTYALGANDFHVTSAYAEFDGLTKFDGTTSFFAGVRSYLSLRPFDWIYDQTNYGLIKMADSNQTVICPILATGQDTNYWLLASYNDYGTNFDIANPDDPSLVGQSNDETDITQRFTLTWNRLALGGDGGGHGCINQTVSYTDFTDGGGGVVGTLVLDEGIPDGAVVQRAILHSLTGFTGGANSTATVQIGDGTVPARYNTGTPDVYTTNASGVDMGAPSGTAWHDAAKSVTITITVDNDWSTISAGEATVAVCYWTP